MENEILKRFDEKFYYIFDSITKIEGCAHVKASDDDIKDFILSELKDLKEEILKDYPDEINFDIKKAFAKRGV
jgi:hypothetical protein